MRKDAQNKMVTPETRRDDKADRDVRESALRRIWTKVRTDSSKKSSA